MDSAIEFTSNIYSSTAPYISTFLSKAKTVAKITLVAIALILIFDAWPSHLCGVGVFTSLSSGSALFFFSTALIVSRKKTEPLPKRIIEVDESSLLLLGPSSSSNLISMEKAGFALTDRTSLTQSNIPTFGADMIWDSAECTVQPMKNWREVTERGYCLSIDIDQEIKFLRDQLEAPVPKKIKAYLLRIYTMGTDAQRTEAEGILRDIVQLYADELPSVEDEKTTLEEEREELKNQIGLIGQVVPETLLTTRGDNDVEDSTIVGVKRGDGSVRYGLLYETTKGVGKVVVETNLASGEIAEKTVPLGSLYTFVYLQAQAAEDENLWEKMQDYLFALRTRIDVNRRELAKKTAEKSLVDTFPTLFEQVQRWA